MLLTKHVCEPIESMTRGQKNIGPYFWRMFVFVLRLGSAKDVEFFHA
jgi:hypothetical protein